jgi:hypothetical protein
VAFAPGGDAKEFAKRIPHARRMAQKGPGINPAQMRMRVVNGLHLS